MSRSAVHTSQYVKLAQRSHNCKKSVLHIKAYIHHETRNFHTNNFTWYVVNKIHVKLINYDFMQCNISVRDLPSGNITHLLCRVIGRTSKELILCSINARQCARGMLQRHKECVQELSDNARVIQATFSMLHLYYIHLYLVRAHTVKRTSILRYIALRLRAPSHWPGNACASRSVVFTPQHRR